MNLQPLGDRLIVEVIEDDEVTDSGIVLPDTAREKPQRGRVIAAGPGKKTEEGKTIPMDVAVGDEIVFEKYAGTEIKIGVENYFVFSQDRVVAKVIGTREPAGATA